MRRRIAARRGSLAPLLVGAMWLTIASGLAAEDSLVVSGYGEEVTAALPATPPSDGYNIIDLDRLRITEGLIEPTDGPFRGFLGIDSTAEPPALVPGAEGPFGRTVDESRLYSIEDIERMMERPTPDEGFADLTLGGCVRIALLRSYDLADAARSLASSSSQRRAAEAEFIPFVDLVYDYDEVHDRTQRTRRIDERNLVPADEQGNSRGSETNTDRGEVRVMQNLPWGGDVGITARDTRSRTKDYRTGGDVENETISRDYRSEIELNYSQPLLRGAGWAVGTAGVKRAQLSEMRQTLGFVRSRRELALGVINAYYGVVRAELDLSVSREALREVARFLEETKIRFELGRIAESEISRVQIQFLQEKQNFIDRLQAYEAAIDSLLSTLGLPLRTQVSLAPVEGQLVDVRLAHIPSLDEGVEEALAQRPEIAESVIGVAEAELSLVIARNDILPDLNADANWLGFDEGLSNDDAYEDLGYRHRWDVGLSLIVPIPNIARREALWRAQLARETAINGLEDLKRSTVRDVKEAYRNLQSTEARLHILARTVEQARRSLAQENARFVAGLNSASDVRDAQDDLFRAQTDYNQALLAAQTDMARLYRALGRPII